MGPRLREAGTCSSPELSLNGDFCRAGPSLVSRFLTAPMEALPSL